YRRPGPSLRTWPKGCSVLGGITFLDKGLHTFHLKTNDASTLGSINAHREFANHQRVHVSLFCERAPVGGRVCLTGLTPQQSEHQTGANDETSQGGAHYFASGRQHSLQPSSQAFCVSSWARAAFLETP